MGLFCVECHKTDRKKACMMRHKKICKKLITVGIAVLLIAVSCMPMTGMRSQAATLEDNGNTVDIYTD